MDIDIYTSQSETNSSSKRLLYNNLERSEANDQVCSTFEWVLKPPVGLGLRGHLRGEPVPTVKWLICMTCCVVSPVSSEHNQ